MRQRTIVTADPELDDLNSMIRLLLYSNEIDIDGLVYASSRYHWKGDGRGTTFFLPDREYDEPLTSWRWAPGERFIDDAIDAYEVVHPNLSVHDPRFPAPDLLRSKVRVGNVAFEGDVSEETPGSRLIADTLLDDDPRPVHLQLWAGPSTVARALMSIEERYIGSDSWESIHAVVSRKAKITKFASQDSTYDEYIRPRWPDIRVVDVAAFAWGYGARRVIAHEDALLLGTAWIRDNITSAGPLGALYRTWGDGRQMVPGDVTDFFHLSGLDVEALKGLGYRVWTDPRPRGEWISEGDTTNMLNLLVPGLRGDEYPGFGGWGGRAVRDDIGRDTWTVRGATDKNSQGETPSEYSVTRWFADAQADFAARLGWSLHPRFEDANHPPKMTARTSVDLDVVAGERVELAVSTNDPDGDVVTCRWWHYREAGTHAGDLSTSSWAGEAVTVEVPRDVRAGETIHIIVEAADGSPRRLKAYQRFILTVVEAPR